MLADLPAPVWVSPRRRAVAPPLPAADGPVERSVGHMLVARVAQLALIFVALTILTLAMSVIAQAVR